MKHASGATDADERAIRSLVERYCDAVARRDEAAWAATWCEDSRWIMGGVATEGRTQIVAQWRQLMGLFEFVFQTPHFGVVELQGERATGRWHVTELGRPQSGGASLTLGMYRDEYLRDEGNWLFGSRELVLRYVGPTDFSGALLPYSEDPAD